jgi:hypothetical protein
MQPQTDIFNNLNLSFWEYMLPGTDAYRCEARGGGVGGYTAVAAVNSKPAVS